ncbi:5'-nucleotidase [Lentzea albidocapillata subsp. violacea]|uniref:5'-nucleotidase n=1 Tax=Lentzea albidocapillata subsp. violacea TaxID=128104 RepID=A0A1G9J1G2_9PSEU|nr:5'/3'-nucleotidase SurE [Lentzea albidocapillata]SDL31319.1 5'-nucleotidase [Lentzea albidocapillata subsp. violacea]
MRALITNDDGIDSPGLWALASAAAECGLEVVVAAPTAQASGTSASVAAVGEHGRVASERRTLPGLDAEAYAVAAHPGLISLIACRGGFGGKPDVVLSGVNLGANVGRAILHSGTVGAALTAHVNDVTAMAVSLDVGLDGPEPLWDKAGEVVRVVLPTLLEMPAATVLSLNVPNVVDVQGLRWAELARFGTVQSRVDDVGDNEVELVHVYAEDSLVPGTDTALLADGFATVTALRSVGRDVSPERALPAWPA